MKRRMIHNKMEDQKVLTLVPLGSRRSASLATSFLRAPRAASALDTQKPSASTGTKWDRNFMAKQAQDLQNTRASWFLCKVSSVKEKKAK